MDIIIDANIYTSASKMQNGNGFASMSRDILDCISHDNHNIVVSKNLKEEYRRNYSQFGLEWYLNMARFGRIIEFENIYDPQLLTELEYGICVLHIPDKEKAKGCCRKIEKDIHLIELALASGSIIMSHEYSCRNHIRALRNVEDIASTMAKLTPIIWIVPKKDHEFWSRWINWLQGGSSMNDWHLVDGDF